MITLTTEQAQQIEEIVEHLLVDHPTARHHKACVEALSIIRAARAQEQEYKGWYCAHCERGVDGSEVTFHEQHEVCGRVITNDVPPKPVKQEPALKVGNLVTINQDPYPALGKLFVQLWDGDDLIARVYANDEETLNKRVAVLNATPVRTKDLTDDEIEAAVLSVNTTMEAWITYRAVIAADREKNK